MAEWGALLRRCPCKADRGFKSLPLRHGRGRRRARSVVAPAVALVAAVLAAIPVGAVSFGGVARAARCAEWVRAKPNDSWSRLAARHGLGLPALLALNDATADSFIRIGDRLCVASAPSRTPAGSGPAPAATARPGRAAVVAIIREVWPDDQEETAIFVARRESKLDPTVVGGRGDCCLGLFQIYWSVHRAWLASAGVTDAVQLLDARTNAEAAYRLYRRNGDSWRPWWTASWRP